MSWVYKLEVIPTPEICFYTSTHFKRRWKQRCKGLSIGDVVTRMRKLNKFNCEINSDYYYDNISRGNRMAYKYKDIVVICEKDGKLISVWRK